jgi:uncharacterized membrane protein YgdD (TMEM256/DUF423 family)
MKYKIIFIAALVGASGVIMGAFGAHTLKEKLSETSLEVIQTGVLYLFIHTTATLMAMAVSTGDGLAPWL